MTTDEHLGVLTCEWLDKYVLKVLLDAVADPSTRGLQGVSELYTAAKDGETDCVKHMLECGTNA